MSADIRDRGEPALMTEDRNALAIPCCDDAGSVYRNVIGRPGVEPLVGITRCRSGVDRSLTPSRDDVQTRQCGKTRSHRPD